MKFSTLKGVLITLSLLFLISSTNAQLFGSSSDGGGRTQIHTSTSTSTGSSQRPLPETLEQVRQRVHRAKADIEAMERLMDQTGDIPSEHHSLIEKMRTMFGHGSSSEHAGVRLPQPVHSEAEQQHPGFLERAKDRLKGLFHRGERATEDAASRVAESSSSSRDSAASVAEQAREQLRSAGHTVENAALGAGHAVQNAARDAGHAVQHAVQDAGHAVHDSAKGFVSRASMGIAEAGDTIKRKATDARETVADAGSAVRDSVIGAAHTAKEKAKSVAEGTREGVTDAAHRVGESIVHAGHVVRDVAQQAAYATKDKILGSASEASQAISSSSADTKEKLEHAKASITDKLFGALSGAKESATETKETVEQKLREMTGRTEPSLLSRAKDKISHMFGREPTMAERAAETYGEWKETLRQKMDAARSATGAARDKAITDLADAFNIAKKEMADRTDALLLMLKGEHKETEEQAKEVHGRLSGWFYDLSNEVQAMQHSMKERIKGLFGRNTGETNFYQASHSEEGIHINYVNDAGEEYLDIEGESLDEKRINKVAIVNAFRRKFNLSEYEKLPESVHMQVRPMRQGQPHVLLKATKAFGNKVVHYTNDDGEESLNVVYVGAPEPYDPIALTNAFRASFGLKLMENLPAGHAPNITTTSAMSQPALRVQPVVGPTVNYRTEL